MDASGVMSSTYVPVELRRLVQARARGVCEYCLIDEACSFLDNEVDHIIAEKHGGVTDEANLACACWHCNRAKGSDIASLVPGTSDLVRLYNPRTDRWNAHFRLIGAEIIGITPIGEATARILGLNEPERLQERVAMMREQLYPSPAAEHLFLA
jgi:hypothetical protein